MLAQLLVHTGHLNESGDRIAQAVKLGIFIDGDILFAEKRQDTQGIFTWWT
jgi:hypothetical protein